MFFACCFVIILYNQPTIAFRNSINAEEYRSQPRAYPTSDCLTKRMLQDIFIGIKPTLFKFKG